MQLLMSFIHEEFLKQLSVAHLSEATGSAVAQAFMKLLDLKAGRHCSCQELLPLHPSSPRAFYSWRSISWTRGQQALINTSLLFFLPLYLNLCLRKNDKPNSSLFVFIFTALYCHSSITSEKFKRQKKVKETRREGIPCWRILASEKNYMNTVINETIL